MLNAVAVKFLFFANLLEIQLITLQQPGSFIWRFAYDSPSPSLGADTGKLVCDYQMQFGDISSKDHYLTPRKLERNAMEIHTQFL